MIIKDEYGNSMCISEAYKLFEEDKPRKPSLRKIRRELKRIRRIRMLEMVLFSISRQDNSEKL